MLEKIDLRVARAISLEQLTAAVSTSARLDEEARVMVAEIVAIVSGQKDMSRRVAVPVDWWQHVKLRFFPEWAKRLWPVRLEVLTISDVRVCPHLPLVNMIEHVKFVSNQK